MCIRRGCCRKSKSGGERWACADCGGDGEWNRGTGWRPVWLPLRTRTASAGMAGGLLGKSSQMLCLDHDFLDTIPKSQTTKVKNECDFHQRQRLLCSRGSNQQIKMQPIVWENVFVNYLSGEGISIQGLLRIIIMKMFWWAKLKSILCQYI